MSKIINDSLTQDAL